MTLLFGRRKKFKNEMRNMNLLTSILIIVFPENKKSHTHTHIWTPVCVYVYLKCHLEEDLLDAKQL